MRLDNKRHGNSIAKKILRIVTPFKRHRDLKADFSHLINIFVTVPIAFHPGFSEGNFTFAIAIHLLIRGLSELITPLAFKAPPRIHSGFYGFLLAGCTAAFSSRIFQSAGLFGPDSAISAHQDSSHSSMRGLWISWVLLSLCCSLAQYFLLRFFEKSDKNREESEEQEEPSSGRKRNFWLVTLLVSLGLLSSNHLTGEIFRVFATLEPSPRFFAFAVPFFSVGFILLRKLLREVLFFRLMKVESATGFSFGIGSLFALSAGSVCVFSFGNKGILLQFGTLLVATLLTSIISEGLLISGLAPANRKQRNSLDSSLGSITGKRFSANPERTKAEFAGLLKNPKAAGHLFLGLISLCVGAGGLHRAALPLLFCLFTIASVTIALLHALEEPSSKPIESLIAQAVSRVVLFVFLSVFCTELIYSIVKAGFEANRREDAIVTEIRKTLQNPSATKDGLEFRNFSSALSSHPSIKCASFSDGGSVFHSCPPGRNIEVRTSRRKEFLSNPRDRWFELSFDHSSLWMGLARRVGVIFFLLLISALTTLYASIRFSRAMSSQLGLILNSINRNTDIHRTEENLSSNLASFKRDLDDLLEIRKIHEAQISRIRAAEQVEHDIRSPLFVLRAILPGVDGVSAEEKRALIESVERISEIAKDLRAIPPSLDPSPRLKDPVSVTCGSPASKAAIPLDSMMTVKSALDSLISEKILEHSKRNPIHLDFDQSLESLGLFAKKETFARVISNLLNNAIEASPAKSAIVVNVRLAEDQSLILSVMDQGKGISAEDLKHMGVRGFTRGKAEGSGLGLWAAREFLTSLGARLEVDSMLDVGTTVSMLFPRECWAMIQAP